MGRLKEFLYKSRIRRRLFTHFIIIAVAPLILVGAVVAWLSFTVQKQQAITLQKEVAIQVATRFDEFLLGAEHELKLAAQVSNLLQLPASKRSQALQPLLTLEEERFEELVFLAPNGDTLAHLFARGDGAGEERDWNKSDAFLTPLETRTSYFGPVHFNVETGEPFMTISIPVSGEQAEENAVLIARIKLTELWRLVGAMSSGRDEDIYILDPKNRIIAHRNPTLVVTGTEFVPLPEGVSKGISGNWVVLGTHSVTKGNQRFTAVAEQTMDKALGIAVSTLRSIIVLFFISLLAACALAYFAIRRIVSPIQNLAQTAKAVQDGSDSIRAVVENHDEIGDLARAFNELTDQQQATLNGLTEKVEELTRMQEKLAQSERRYRDIYEQASEGIFLCDGKGAILDANPHALRVLEYSHDEILKLSLQGVIHESSQDEWPIPSLMESIRAGQVIRVERRFLQKNGAYITVAMGIKAIGFDLVQVMFHDISTRKVMEEALRDAKTLAETANRAKGEFLANISHEIRTPLSCIIGMSELSLEAELDEDLQENLEMILDSALSLLDIINDILDLAKIEAKGITLASIKFNLKFTLEKTLRTFATQASRKENKLYLEIDPSVPEVVMGDPGRLSQVVRNLVGNAIKFTEQGTITVKVSRVDISEDIYTLQFSVIDTGIGIPESKLQLLFSSFSQLDSSYSKKFQGTGLGLSISKKLSEMMEGRIWVESEEGKGSNFSFTALFGAPEVEEKGAELPSKHEGNSRKSKPDFVAKHGPMKILFAEDNKVNQLFITDFLKSAGHDVTPVGNGLEALIELEQGRFDLVLMDIQMPEMDGVEAARQVRGGDRDIDPSIPILALTAYAMKEDKERFRTVGMNGCITKPVEKHTLLKSLDVLAENKNIEWIDEQTVAG